LRIAVPAKSYPAGGAWTAPIDAREHLQYDDGDEPDDPERMLA
jgi:hypothetical protein